MVEGFFLINLTDLCSNSHNGESEFSDYYLYTEFEYPEYRKSKFYYERGFLMQSPINQISNINNDNYISIISIRI
jgi:hypothetical protein